MQVAWEHRMEPSDTCLPVGSQEGSALCWAICHRGLSTQVLVWSFWGETGQEAAQAEVAFTLAMVSSMKGIPTRLLDWNWWALLPRKSCIRARQAVCLHCLQLHSHSGSFPMSGSSHLVAKVLELHSASVLLTNIQGWFPLGWTGLNSLQSKGLSRVFPSTTTWKPQFFSTQPSLWSNCHIRTWLEKPELWLYGLLSAF